MMEEKIIKDRSAVLRHSPVELAEHWLLALSGLLLIFSGFGELPMYKRYMVTQIPGLGWAGDFFVNLKIHYLAGIGLILVLTGMVKVIKNLPGVYLSPAFITSMTLIHTFSTIFFLLGVLAHLAALIFKVNRPLVKSVFTGEVVLAYVKERHTVWYEELVGKKVEDEGREEVKVEAEVKNQMKQVKAQVEVEGEKEERREKCLLT